MAKKLETAAIFFPSTMFAEGVEYKGGSTYNLRKTPGTIDRWLKRGCDVGNAKGALKDPRFYKQEPVETPPSKGDDKNPDTDHQNSGDDKVGDDKGDKNPDA